MSQGIGLRLATVSDAFQIANLSRDLVETGLGWSWTPPRVIRSIRCADTAVLVADTGRQIAGFAIMYFGAEEAHLSLLAVKPNYQRSGVARRLIEWLEASALVAGISVAYLEVRANNRGAQTFYERLGYRKIAHVPNYYSGRESALYMARDLLCSTSTEIR
ncbi:MAG: ribosomal protein S18-alanine N-acetyltransferase [Gammaproteobacteria bacterium]